MTVSVSCYMLPLTVGEGNIPFAVGEDAGCTTTPPVQYWHKVMNPISDRIG